MAPLYLFLYVTLLSSSFFNLYIHISNLYFVMHDLCLRTLRVTVFDTEDVPFSDFQSFIKIACIILRSLFCIPFWGQTYFMKISPPDSNTFFLFILRYRPVRMTEGNLNANNNADICPIPSKFHMLMYYRIIKKCIHKISETYIFLRMGSRS